MIDIREPGTQHLLFRYDQSDDVVEVRRGGTVTTVNLTVLRATGDPDRAIMGRPVLNSCKQPVRVIQS